jgi:hypothetical protein
MVYNGYYKVMSNIPKMGQLPTPDQFHYINDSLPGQRSSCHVSSSSAHEELSVVFAKLVSAVRLWPWQLLAI